MPRKKVIDQVLKLLALAESSTHSGEVESARRKAEELLLRHEIASGELREEDAFETVEHDSGYARAGKYRIRLADLAARFNGAYLVFSQHGTTRYTFYGRKSDVANALYMYAILLDQLQRSRRRAAVTFRQLHGRAMTSAESNGFSEGFCSGVRDKLQSLTQIVSKGRAGAGLVPLGLYEQLRQRAEEAYRAANRVRGSGWRGSLVDRQQLAAGYADGSRASLHRGVETQREATRRLGR